jgi:phospholipase/carboxylesterase
MPYARATAIPDDARRGHLRARPKPQPATRELAPGLHALGLDRRRDAILYLPPRVSATAPTPLVALLHGAGADADDILPVLTPLADEAGFMVLAPCSRGDTWDALRGGLGPDVAFLDRALAATFLRVTPDRTRLAIAGFSDGASYALTLALGNGELFTHGVAFSPGFVGAVVPRGRPRVFVAHGRRDAVLPIDACSRRVVPQLRGHGYDVRYDEFTGGHTVPPAVARDAVAWFLEPA